MLTTNAAGYKIEVGDDRADCTNQAHVFISDYRINPPPELDGRTIDEIVEGGIREEFNSLDVIRPLAHTVLHEVRIDPVYRFWTRR